MIEVKEKNIFISERIKGWLQDLTLEEKARLCMGKDSWNTFEVKRLNIPSITVSDGPHGLRKQKSTTDGDVGLNDSIPSTCFPPAALTSCSFNRDLIYNMGAAIGEEARLQEIDVVLGPAINIKRSPLCGRNFEYVSEDPYVAGEYATAFIKGVQDEGVGTSIKHFALNNQETLRMNIDAVVDERALREIYLYGFERAVKEAEPYTVMASYNRINGEYGCENNHNIREILRKEWGFQGLVMSDWSAINDVVKAIKAGCDLEMPYSGRLRSEEIIEAVKKGILKEEILDEAVINVLRLVEKCCTGRNKEKLAKEEKEIYDLHDELARKIAADSMVLLKNEGGFLPLQKDKKYALIGAFADTPRYQGGGSSHITPTHLTSLKKACERENLRFTYSKGYDVNKEDTVEELIVQAVNNAKEADVAIVLIGLTDIYEYEGLDRQSMDLPPAHVELLKRVREVNENIVVVLCAGSAVTMEWDKQCKGLLYASVMGQAGGQAIFDILFGRVNPSGKLTETFPMELKDTPAYENFPGGNNSVHYMESIYVGYRYYATARVPVKYPFGHGLSYTEFKYSDMKVNGPQVIKPGQSLNVSIKVKNVGAAFGGEVVQIYLRNNCGNTYTPAIELKDFEKVYLASQEERIITFNISYDEFRRFDITLGWIADAGSYTVFAGSSSEDLRESVSVDVEGQGVNKDNIDLKCYRNISSNHFNKEDFKVINNRELPPLNIDEKEIHMNTPLGQCGDTFPGKMLYKVAKKVISDANPGDEGEATRRALIGGVKYTPIRSLVVMQGGNINLKTGEGIVELLKGRYIRGLVHILKSMKYHYK